MRKSKQETAETRQRIVETASVEFRRGGLAETGLASLMGAAGLTHGGFYKHFESKDQVVEESLTLAAKSMADDLESKLTRSPGPKGLNAAIADYLSVDHLDRVTEGCGCTFVALASEVARSSVRVREVTTAGFQRLVGLIAAQIVDVPPAAAKKKALMILCTMIGAMTAARMVADPELSASILLQARKQLAQ